MKRLFLLMASSVTCSMLSAQVKEGTIVYDRKINLHRGVQDAQMKAMLPEFRSSKHILLFSDSVSVFKRLPEDETPDPFAQGGSGGQFTIRMGGAADAGELYKNFSQSKSVLSTELGGKNFLVLDTIRQQPWKLTGETKQLLGLTCLKATRKIPMATGGPRQLIINRGTPAPQPETAPPPPTEVEVVAWYAENLVSPVGPESHGQLPGVILQLDVDNGRVVYTASEIKKTFDAKELKEPKKGKLISNAEFTKLQAELFNNVGPGGIRIRG